MIGTGLRRAPNGVVLPDSPQGESAADAEPFVGAPLPLGQRTASALRRDALHRWMLAVADVLAAALALVTSTVVLGDDALAPAALLTIPFVVLACKVVGLYDRDEYLLRRTTLEEASSLFRVATLFALLIGFGERVFIMGHLGRDQVIALWAIMLVSMLVARAGARRLSRSLAPIERCLVLGDAEAAQQVRRCVDSTDRVRAAIVGRVPLEAEPAHGEDRSVLGEVGRLGTVLKEHRIDRVVISPGHADTDAILDAIGVIKATGVDVSMLPRLLDVVGSSVEFDEIEGLVLLGVRGDGLSRSSRLVKRGLDLLGALTLIVVLAPVMTAIALALRLGDSGPVLVRTPCAGYRGRTFMRLDFRMPLQAARGAGRTLTTRLLDATSLYALPQLVNVLRGDMSLVGPRPCINGPERLAKNTDLGLDLLPGLTGAWRGYGPAALAPGEAVKADYGYAANWSLWLDARILLRTVPLLLTRDFTRNGARGVHGAGAELPPVEPPPAALVNGRLTEAEKAR